MNGSAGSEASPAARGPLEVVRRLYRAWNAGNVAGAAELLAPDVRWESFGTSAQVDGPQGLQETLAGGATGGTWMLSPVTVELLVQVVDHVIACSRRSRPQGEPEAERLEVWTLRDGRAVHYRGYPLDEGLAVLSQTTGSRRLEAVCRDVLAFNRGDVGGWVQLLETGPEPGQRLDDVQVLAESDDVLVISSVRRIHDAGGEPGAGEPLNLVISFEGDRARRVTGHATPGAALAAARAPGPYGSL